jgi:MFS family permease
MSVFYLIVFMTTAFLSFNLAFFLMFPIFKCPTGTDVEGNTIYKECTRHEICSNQPVVGVKSMIDVDHKYSLNNWIERFDLECGAKWEIGLFGSMFFLGYISSCLIFPPLADAYGRKKFAVGVCIQ